MTEIEKGLGKMAGEKLKKEIELAFHKVDLAKEEIDFINSAVEDKIDEIAMNTTYKNTELIALQSIIKHQNKEIEKLKKENQKEREKNKKAYNGGYEEGFKYKVSENWKKSKARTLTIKSEYISKDKIREKIKELEEDKEKSKIWSDEEECVQDYQIEILKELLEEK